MFYFPSYQIYRVIQKEKPPIQWVPGVLPQGVKRGRGVTLTTHPPSSAEGLSMSRSYTSSPPMCLHGM
jgi:hypothetical protein